MRFPRPPWGERPPPDERVDRPEVEAPRGAREPTGTNGPTLNNNPHHACGCNNKQRTINCRNHYTNHDQPTPPHANSGGDSVEHQSCGGHSTGETPSNIPNLDAKPGSANGTATDRLWESRTPPQPTHPGAARNLRVSGRFLYSHARTQAQGNPRDRRTTNPLHCRDHAVKQVP